MAGGSDRHLLNDLAHDLASRQSEAWNLGCRSLGRGGGARARAAGDDVDLVTLQGVGHDEHLDPASTAWGAVVERLP